MPSRETILAGIPNVRRIENFETSQMQELCMELTHAVYPHEEIYGQFCTLQKYVDCPPEEAFAYLRDPMNLAEWTYSMRGFEPTEDPNVLVSLDRIGESTRIYTRTVTNQDARTVDFHCAWDQSQDLWMIYLMRVVSAELVLDRPGSVILWSNCKHPYYDENPFPGTVPQGRSVWVGDLWPFFYAGHLVEMKNLKAILEHRHATRSGVAEEKAA